MATGRKSRKAQPVRWKGDAVEARPIGEAERAAQRAEGREPIRADVESERLHDSSDARDNPPPRPVRHADPEGEIADVAEEHRERWDAGERPPRGKL
jgi:hypothetical protein